MSDEHTVEERAAVRWWRKEHPEHATARLRVVRHNGTVFSYLVMPKPSNARWGYHGMQDRCVASLDEVVDAYSTRAALAAAKGGEGVK